MAACVALFYAAVIFHTGARLSSDSWWYSRWADALVAAHFNIREFLAHDHSVLPPELYLVWIMIVTLSKVLLGDGWPNGIVFLNWVSATLVVYGIMRTTAGLTTSVILGVMAAVIFATAYDVLVFLPYVLSDIIFMALSAAILLLGLSMVGTSDADERRGRLLAGTSLVLIACVFRPTAAPLVVYWAGCVLVAFRDGLRVADMWRAIVALAGVAAVLIVLDAALMQDPSRWPGVAGAGWIQQLSGETRKGIVVFGRPETYVAPPRTMFDFVTLTLAKCVYYFAPWMSAYSRFHKLANATFFLPVYALSLVAVLRSRRWRLAAMLVLYLGAFSLFHGVQQLDYDHRYRLPVLPALSVLAALGLEVLAAPAIARRENNYSPLVPTTVQL